MLKLPALPQLQQRERLLVAGAVVVLILVALDRLVLSPWLGHADRIRDNVLRMEETLKKHSRLLSRQEGIRRDLQAYEAYFRPIIEDDLQMAALLTEVEALAQMSGIEIEEIKPFSTERNASLVRYSLDVRFECDLDSWVEFVFEIQSSFSMFSVERASLGLKEDVPDKLAGSLRLVSASLLSNGMAPLGASGKPGVAVQ